MGQTVLVAGAGVIGLAAAYFLSAEGLQVTVVDQGQPGSGCSYGNMGWVCPSLSEPLPSPGIVRSSLAGMLDGSGPLYIKPAEGLHMAPWVLNFWRASSPPRYAAGLEANLWLSRHTLALYDEWASAGVVFEMHREGLVYAFLDADAWQKKLMTLSPLVDFGFPAPEPLPKEALLTLEPDLSPKVVGGIRLPAERHVRADTLIRGLVERLRAAGVDVRSDTAVDAIETARGRVQAFRVGPERLRADAYVLAAGAWTGPLARSIGLKLPIVAGKGYSLTFREPNLIVRHALYLGDSKVAVSPYAGALRVGGTMEFSGFNTRLDARRVDGIRRAARQYFRAAPVGRSTEVWVGMRPMTPDGLPIIGRTPQYDNLFVASGHGSDGVFMAPATGALLRDVLLDRPRPPLAGAFDPGRFH